MPSKPQSPGPNTTLNPPAKLSKPKKPTTSIQPKATTEKPQPSPSTQPTKTTVTTATTTTTDKARRKPRKLTRETPITSTPTTPSTSTSTPTPAALPAAADDLEALKSRVRGLEAKVEELCRTGASRSPRRRGKGGRKTSSSATTVPTLKTTGGKKNDIGISDARIGREKEKEEGGEGGEEEEGEEEADEELQRVESELAGARRDLALFDPKGRQRQRGARRTSTATTMRDEDDNDDDDVEEIPTHRAENNRSVTLSGSYRIPLPATVSIDDVKTIQSGVSAAQNVARRVLEQRRATATQSIGTSSVVGGDEGGGGTRVVQEKKSWGDWIGGYSVAISRAVKSIEHEAAVEGRRGGTSSGNAPRSGGAAGTRKKRPGVKAKLSSEQVQGLMS